MDRYYTQTIGTEIYTSSGMVAGKVIEIAIDPDTGKIAGFLLAPKGQYVIGSSDVVFWDKHLFIYDIDDILEAGEIIKVKEVLQKNISIMHQKVYTKSGLYVGKVYDIGMSPKFFVMTKIVVAKNILGMFPYNEKIINSIDVLEITKNKIIVKDLEEKISIKEKKPIEEKLQIDIAPSA